jgi:hypothetical protein
VARRFHASRNTGGNSRSTIPSDSSSVIVARRTSKRVHRAPSSSETRRLDACKPALYEFDNVAWTLGGPVLVPGSGFNRGRNRLFFFWSQDLPVRTTPVTPLTQQRMPTALERAGDFSQTRDSNGALVLFAARRRIRICHACRRHRTRCVGRLVRGVTIDPAGGAHFPAPGAHFSFRLNRTVPQGQRRSIGSCRGVTESQESHFGFAHRNCCSTSLNAVTTGAKSFFERFAHSL